MDDGGLDLQGYLSGRGEVRHPGRSSTSKKMEMEGAGVGTLPEEGPCGTT